MWDAKRQTIWLASGITVGTLVIYFDAHDDLGNFEPWVFVFWETILLGIIAVMFYIYSRKSG